MSKSKSYRKYAATSMAVAVAASAVAPVVAGAEEVEFSDVSKDSPHYDAIIAMAKEGIIQGDNGKFAPYENVYRIQVAKMLQRALNLEVPSNADQIIRGYSDITANYTQEDRDAIAAVTAAGIFQGSSDRKFNAWTPINREQMASVIVRAFGLDQVEAGNVNINLSNVDRNHRDNVQILANLGLTDALSDYRPAELTNREQFASFLYRTVNAVDEVGFKVADVIGLDDNNRYLQISFNQQVKNLEPANIKIVDAKTEERYGVKEVNLSSDGLSAQVELFAHEGVERNILQYNRDYVVTVNANGQVSEFIFNRPAFIEERVIEIDVAERQIVVDNRGILLVLKVPSSYEDFNFQEVLGEKVRIWYNEDNEVVNYKVDEYTTVYDAVEFTKDDEIKLLTSGNKHKYSKEVYKFDSGDIDKIKLYKNGETAQGSNAIATGDKYTFAKVGLDKSGNVEFIGVYELPYFLIVDKVEGNDVIGLAADAVAEGEFNAKDATIIKDNKVISLDDLEKGDILFFNEDANDKDGFAEVYNNAVSGEIDNVYRDSARINGETYDYKIDADDVTDFGLEYNGAAYQKENGKLDEVDHKAAEKLQKAGAVSVYLDRAGHPVYFSGELADVQSDTKSSLVVDMKFDQSFNDALARLEVVTQDGKEELHQVLLKDLRTISFNGKEFDVKNNATGEDEASIKFDNGSIVVEFGDASITDYTLVGDIDDADTSDVSPGDLINVVYNDSGKVTGLELFGVGPAGNEGTDSGDANNTLEADDTYAKGHRLLSDTVVFDATDAVDNNNNFKPGFDADDISVTTWGEYSGSDIDNYDLVYNNKNEVVALVIKSTTVSDQVYDSTVITDVLRNTDNEIVEIKTYIDGKEVWLDVDKHTNADVEKGTVAVLEFSKNNKDLVKTIHTSGAKYDDRVKSLGQIGKDDINTGSREVTVGSDTYRLVGDGAVIDISDKNDIGTKRLRDLEGKNVFAVLDSDGGTFVKYFVYGGTVNTGGGNTPPVVDNAIDNQTATVGTPLNIGVDNTFTDADGDTLTFTASSSDEEVATASVTGDTLTVTAISEGTATITVTADDGNGGTASTTFNVDVEPASIDGLNDISVNVGADDSSNTVTLQSSESVEVESADDTIATVTVENENEIKVTGVAANTTTITVTIKNVAGKVVARGEFEVTVQ